MKSRERLQTWSCGGGTQSVAIAALIVQGRLPKPDLAAIVDTEREKGETWEYFETVLRPKLLQVGVDVVRVPKSRYATVDLYGTKGDLLLPVFTTRDTAPGDEPSKMPAFCSNEWKQRVFRRWLKEQGVEWADCWIGFSTDEVRRLRHSDVAWLQNRFPLVFEVPLSRHGCKVLVEQMGWPTPPRSACWMCSNMGDLEWERQRTHYPEEFAAAAQLEREFRAQDPDFYLHESGIPLDQVDFTAPRQSGLQGSLFDEDRACASGMCWV